MANPKPGPPVDGRGGLLWKYNITFPVYPSYPHPNGAATITWAELDSVFLRNEQINATAGICFGLCLIALLNMVALTPKSKRGLPLYRFILIALALLTSRYLTLMILYTDLEVGSAYYSIAADYNDGESLCSIVAIVFVIWLPAVAFLFVVLCLYVQGKCVLVLLALKHRYIYIGMMSYLLSLSIGTIILRMVGAVFATINQFNANFVFPHWIKTVVLTTYTATMLSWSLVFSWQVGMVIFNRYRLGGPLDKNEGLAILFMTGVESMLIPMIFSILQLLHIPWFPNAEYLIMPSIACIIPFGSIWASAANQNASLQRANHITTAAPQIRCDNCSEMMSTTGRDLSPTSHSPIDHPLPGTGSSTSRRISRFPAPAPAAQGHSSRNDSTLSGATTVRLESHPHTHTTTSIASTQLYIFPSMPMKGPVL